MGGGPTPRKTTNKTVVILGGAYGGARAAQILAAGIPDNWRIILVDRNSHVNHVYVMPRYSVLPGHEYKAFIPYNNIFLTNDSALCHVQLQAKVVLIRPGRITLSKVFPELGYPKAEISFDYAIFALGSHLPAPLNLWGDVDRLIPKSNVEEYKGTKKEAICFLKDNQQSIKDASSILVVGGGALGIQFATDIKSIYPEKNVTLLHSRLRLLPRFKEAMHTEVIKSLAILGVQVILGERLDIGTIKTDPQTGRKSVRTITGREIVVDLLLICTGQTPNTNLLKDMDPSTVNPDSSLAHVLRTMQLGTFRRQGSSSATEELLYPNIFVIGDAADAFGAIAAGHTAFYQGEVAARNILRLIKQQEQRIQEDTESEPLEHYTPGPPAIKVSLGLTRSVYQLGETVGTKDDGQDDLQAAAIWPLFGIKVEKDEDMYP